MLNNYNSDKTNVVTKEEVTELVIDRTKWNRGRHSMLLNEQGMCCLGFLGLACGYSTIQLKDKAYPDTLISYGFNNLFPDWLFAKWRANQKNDKSESIQYQLAIINDKVEIADEEREKILTKEFAKHGIAVTFIN